MSYYGSPATSPSVIPKTGYYEEEEERILSPSRRLGVYNRRNVTPTIFDYTRRGRVDYDEEEEEGEDEFEDEGEYTRGTPVRSPPSLYQPSRYRTYPRDTGYAPRRIEF